MGNIQKKKKKTTFDRVEKIVIDDTDDHKNIDELEIMDIALNQYYYNLNRYDYFSSGLGRFSEYCHKHNIAGVDMEKLLKYDANDCLLVDFDKNFPYENDNANPSRVEILNILRYCHKHGESPIKTAKNISLHKTHRKTQSNTIFDDIKQPNVPEKESVGRERQEVVMKVLHPDVFEQVIEQKVNSNVRRNYSIIGISAEHGLLLGPRADRERSETVKTETSKFKHRNRKRIEKYKMEKYGGKLIDNLSAPQNDQPELEDLECCVNTCVSRKRIIEALQYYETLDMINIETDKQQLVQFCHVNYAQVLDDFIHIVTIHDDEQDLEKIFGSLFDEHGLKKCNITKCMSTVRHHRHRLPRIVKTDTMTADADQEFVFYQDLMDQVHCYLYHLYDAALRVKKNEIIDQHDESQEYIDDVFSNMLAVIHTKTKEFTKVVNDPNRISNNKFNMNITNSSNEGTYIDGLFECLQTYGKFQLQQIQSFFNTLQEEEYDSDAIEADVGYPTLNIALYDQKLRDAIKDYQFLIELHQKTFHIGYRLYYWDYYKQSHDNSMHGNIDLFVKRKYVDLKEEILNNKIFTLGVDELRMSVHKTTKFVDTEKVKSTKATPDFGDQLIEHDRDDDLHYGIKAGTIISFKHLLSIVLYCDWSELCTKFSGTFRKAKSYYPLSTVKQNNTEYANWSRLLRESVELFGFSWSGQFNPNFTSTKNKIINRLKGPFYCGMSFVILIPEIKISLCGPTSTSKHAEVATRFGGEGGIIIQLNNTKNVNVFSDNVCAFRCAWLSNYSGEDEYLFVGGKYRLTIETIIRMDTMQNFSNHFSALYDFESIINGTSGNENKSNEKKEEAKWSETKLLQNWKSKQNCVAKLIKHKLNVQEFKNEFPEYINSTFTSFVNSKKHIIINLPFIYRTRSVHTLCELILYPKNKFVAPKPTYEISMVKYAPFIRQFFQPQNVDLLQPILFKLFNNIEHIVIYSTSNWGNVEYAFNLTYFASSVFSVTERNLILQVKAVDRYDCATWKRKQVTNSWLKNMTSISRNKHVKVKMTREKNEIGRNQDCVTIWRKQPMKYYQILMRKTIYECTVEEIISLLIYQQPKWENGEHFGYSQGAFVTAMANALARKRKPKLDKRGLLITEQASLEIIANWKDVIKMYFVNNNLDGKTLMETSEKHICNDMMNALKTANPNLFAKYKVQFKETGKDFVGELQQACDDIVERLKSCHVGAILLSD